MGARKLLYNFVQVLPNNYFPAYPLHTGLPNRHEAGNEYRYGFQGQEKDDEITGIEGSHLDFGARIYDSRVGRWLSRDPLEKKYPFSSGYVFVLNSPLYYVDPDGKKVDPVINEIMYDWEGIYLNVAWSNNGKNNYGATVVSGLKTTYNHKRGKVSTSITFQINLSAMFDQKHKYYNDMVYRNEIKGNKFNWFLEFKSRVIKHEMEHIQLQMEFANMDYSVELKTFYDDNVQTYNGDPGEILQQYYDRVSSQILENDFGGKKYKDLTESEKKDFEELVDGEMSGAINLMNIVIKAKKNMTEEEEENETQNRTSFNEIEWIKIIVKNGLPYTEEEAEEMNANPESAKKEN